MGVIAEEAVRITADTAAFKSQVEGGVTGVVKKAAAAIGGIFAAEKIGDWAKEAISGAADLEKQQRRVEQVFGSSGEGVLKFGEGAAKSYGLGALSADKMTASLGQVLKSTGLSGKASADMSINIVKLASDLGSFTGKDPSRVFTALQKGTLGATRGLKEYGINISQADVKNQALASGLVKPIKNTLDLQNAQIRIKATTEALTTAIEKHGVNSQEAAKATLAHNNAEVQLQKALVGTVPPLTTLQKEQASYQLIMKAGSIASGDFQKHSHDLGNEQKILGAEFQNISDSIGKVLLPAVTAVGAVLIEDVPKGVNAAKAAFDTLRPAFDVIGQALQPVVNLIKTLFDAINSDRPAVEAFAAVIGVAATAWLAYQAAMQLALIAMKAATVAELALNLVMDANPIAIVVIAIAALAAGLVILYQRSQTAQAIMNAVWGALKAAAADALGYITNTVIPAAQAAWQRFGPAVVAALQAAASGIRAAVQAIATVVTTVVDQIQAHWKQVWDAIGPVVTAAFNTVRVIVQTEINVIRGLITAAMAILHGNWADAWHAMEGVVGDVLNGVKQLVSIQLGALEATAGRLAVAVGQAIANGIKNAAAKLTGMAGDILASIGAAVTTVAGAAYGEAVGIGEAIVRGILGGLTSLPSELGSKLTGFIHSGISAAGSLLHGSGPFQFTIEAVGVPMAQGIVDGLAKGLNQFGNQAAASLDTLANQVASATTKNAPKIATAFKSWATQAKSAFDQEVSGIEGKLQDQLNNATKAIDNWKAKLTPAEIKLNATQALNASIQLQASLHNAWQALADLPAAQAKAMTDLMAQQQKVMDGLKQTLQGATDDAIVAGARFQNQSAAAAGDPLAGMLISAQQTFDATKAAFDAGTATQAQFVAASNALDDAKVKASEDSNATQLLDQYNTWQTALAQQAAAGGAITTQQAQDAAAQQALQAQQAQDTLTAQGNLDSAQQAMDLASLQTLANNQRAARDAEAVALNAALVARFNRIKTHLDNVRDITDAHFAEMARHASDGGNNLIEALSAGIRGAMPTLTSALTAIANAIRQYLKVSSPTEKGPMSDLDKWWTNLGPTLVGSFDSSGIKAALTDAVTVGSGGSGSIGYPRSGSNGMSAGEQHIAGWLEKIWKQGKESGGAGKPTTVQLEAHVTGGIGVDASVYRARR